MLGDRRSAVGRHPWRTLGISVAVIVIAIGGAGVLWIDHQGNKGITGGPAVIVHVHQGEGMATVTAEVWIRPCASVAGTR